MEMGIEGPLLHLRRRIPMLRSSGYQKIINWSGLDKKRAPRLGGALRLEGSIMSWLASTVVERTIVWVFPEKCRAIVFKVDAVAEVAVPYRVVIVGIARKFAVVDGGRTVSRIGINGCRCRCVNGSRCGVNRSRCYISAAVDGSAVVGTVVDGCGDTDPDRTETGADIDLGVAFCCEKGTGYDGCKYE